VITNKKAFTFGIVLLITFICLFYYIMTPSFGNGLNGLQYADNMFNSLAKGSANFIQDTTKKANSMNGHEINVNIKAADAAQAQTWEKLYTAAGINITVDDVKVGIKGDLGTILKAVVNDSNALYNNQGEVLFNNYGLEAKEVGYGWHTSLKAVTSALDKQQNFKESAAVQNIVQKAVEPGYNYYGIEPKKVTAYAVTVSLLLIFYVVYTLWYGFALFFLSEGFGVTASKSSKGHA